MKFVLSILFALFLIYWLRPFSWPNHKEYYAPVVYGQAEYLSISIPVEVDDKDGKKAFVKLFEKYGFSGNGPSIEQVVRTNNSFDNVEYGSEGDSFFMYVKDKADFDEILSKMKCIENTECLNRWLNKSRVALIKE